MGEREIKIEIEKVETREKKVRKREEYKEVARDRETEIDR